MGLVLPNKFSESLMISLELKIFNGKVDALLNFFIFLKITSIFPTNISSSRHCIITSEYRKRFLISACFFHACTPHNNEVNAYKNHALLVIPKTVFHTFRLISNKDYSHVTRHISLFNFRNSFH